MPTHSTRLFALIKDFRQSRNYLFGLVILVTLLSACGGGGGGADTTTSDSTTEDITSGGTASNPAVLSIEATYTDSLPAAGTVYYRFTTDASPFRYEFDLQGVSSTIMWTMYSDTSYSTSSVVDSCYQSSDTSDCATNNKLAANTTYYLKMQEASGSNINFSIRIRRILDSEGSLDAPVVLTVGQTYQGTLGAKNYSSAVVSYYKFTTNSSDSIYTIDLSGATTDVKWQLYSGSWNTAVRDCDNIWAEGDESCVTATLTGSAEYLMKVETQGPESTYVNITVTEGGTDTTTTVDEGSVASPVALTLEQSHNGSISPSGTSYYQFTTGDVAAHYLIKVEHRSTGLDLNLYSDNGFTNRVDNHVEYFSFNATSWYTIALDPNSTFYLEVIDNVYGAMGDEYKITIYPDLVRDADSEGTKVTPIELTVDVPYTTGTVGSSSTSYYQVTFPEAKPYRISLTNSETDLSWTLVSDWDDIYGVTHCNNAYDNSDEVCDLNTKDAGTTLYLYVSEYNNAVPSTYHLLVETIEGEGEGTVNTPVTLTPGMTRLSSISASGASVYEFITGAEMMVYRISITGATSDTEWGVNETGSATYVYDNTCDRFSATLDDEICDTLPLLPDTRYMIYASENSGARTDISITVDTGTPIQNVVVDTVLNDSVDGYSNAAFYKFTTNSVDTIYTVSVTEDVSASLDYARWELFVDDTYSGTTVAFCMATASGSQNISCTVTGLSLDTTYYLRLDTSYANNFDLLVSSGDVTEGSIVSPVNLTLGASHTGAVASRGTNYYQFTTASGGPKLTHAISLQMSSTVDVRLYDDASFTNQIDSCYSTDGTFTGCTTTTSLSTGTTYYLSLKEYDGYAGSLTLTVN